MSSAPSLLTREEGTSTPWRRARWLRPSAPHLLIAISVLLAFVFNLLALRGGPTQLIALADGAIPAGTPLSAARLRWVPVDAGFEGLAALVNAESIDALGGALFARSIPAGTPIDEASLRPEGSSDGLRTMSVPIGMEHAVGSELTRGDRVDTISVIDGAPGYIAVDLEVVGISEPQGLGLSAGSPHHVLLAVSSDDALQLARALDTGSLELVRSTGARPIGRGSE